MNPLATDRIRLVLHRRHSGGSPSNSSFEPRRLWAWPLPHRMRSRLPAQGPDRRPSRRPRTRRPALAAGGDRRNRPRILQATSTAICVICKSLKRRRRGFDDSSSPSAKTPSRDIPFHRVHRGRKPAECGHSWRIVRTTAPGPRCHFGPVSVSLGPLSPTQPNHGRFGTDVGSPIIQ
jgi:hypothetical protein